MAGGTRSEASSSNSSNSSSKALSVVVDCGRRRSSCGYCRSSGHTSISHGLLSHSMTVYDYQDLLDRGWRRSGRFLYKPEMEKTCCPSYTIRLKASDFTPSKEQRRVIRRMQRFLDGTFDLVKDNMVGPSSSARSESKVQDNNSSSGSRASTSADSEGQNEAKSFSYLSEKINNIVLMFSESGEFCIGNVLPKASVKKVSSIKKKTLVEGSEDILCTSNIAFQIAAAMRRAHSADKGVDQSRKLRPCSEENGPSPTMIAEKLAASLNQHVEIPGLSVKACNGHINFYSASNQASSDDSIKKGVTFDKSGRQHGSRRNHLKNLELPLTKRRKLELRLKRSTFDPEEFSLFRRYQMKVHNDTEDHVTESSYRRFLVDSPLIFVSPTNDGTVPSCGFGSFHQQYVIDGHLVAVGVIDILPNCLSSKYLFWDPDYAFLSLGKYSALQEIEWVKKNQVDCPSLEYYYLGYYIHSCRKMRYKAAYHPSELLCPLRYQWVPFDIAKPLLDRRSYVVLSDFPLQNEELSLLTEKNSETHCNDPGEDDANDISMDEDEEMVDPESDSSDDESDLETSDLASGYADSDVGNALIGLHGSCLRYKDLQSAFGAKERSYLESQLHKFKTAVGAELSKRMVYSLG